MRQRSEFGVTGVILPGSSARFISANCLNTSLAYSLGGTMVVPLALTSIAVPRAECSTPPRSKRCLPVIIASPSEVITTDNQLIELVKKPFPVVSASKGPRSQPTFAYVLHGLSCCQCTEIKPVSRSRNGPRPMDANISHMGNRYTSAP